MSPRHQEMSWCLLLCITAAQVVQEGKCLAEDHRGVRIGNGWVQTMTLFPQPREEDMASTWPEGEAPLHSSKKRQLMDAFKSKIRSFPSPQPFPWCVNVAARAGPLTWETWPGLHQMRRPSPSRGLVAMEGHLLPRTLVAACISSSCPFSSQNSH